MEEEIELISDDGSLLGNRALSDDYSSDESVHLDNDDTETLFAKENSESLKNRANAMANIATSIFKKAKAPITADKNLWIFSNSVLLLFSNPSFEVLRHEEKEESVDGILKNYGFIRRKVAGNGDC
jgi:hypothetical protein